MKCFISALFTSNVFFSFHFTVYIDLNIYVSTCLREQSVEFVNFISEISLFIDTTYFPYVSASGLPQRNFIIVSVTMYVVTS